jgi:amidophosphoribosyltransferase (EC 2.4.2.14)
VGVHGFDFAIVATESAAVEILGGEVPRSLAPGEEVEITKLSVKARGAAGAALRP